MPIFDPTLVQYFIQIPHIIFCCPLSAYDKWWFEQKKAPLFREKYLVLSYLKGLIQRFKGSVERSLLPWAIFLIFTRNRPWKSEDYLCTLFFIEMSKERLEKSERTPPVSWRPWALAYSPDRPYNFSCFLSAVSKKRRFGSFFSASGCHLARKSLSWTAMPVSNKKQEFEQRKLNQTVRWLLSAWVPIRFCPEAPASSTVDVNSRFSRFQFSAFWSNGLASSVFIFAPILLRFFLLCSSMQGLKYVVTDFLISTCKKSYAASKPTG